MTKLLVVKLAAIGDVVLSLAALDAIREEHPAADITLLTGEVSAPLVQHHPAVNRIWPIDETIFWKKKWLPLLRLALALIRQRYDRVYILHWSPLFHHFFRLLRVPERWGFARDAKASSLTRQVPYVEGRANAHDCAQYLNAVSERYSVGPVPQKIPRIYLTPNEEAWAMHEMKSATLPIAMAPGGGNNAKLFMPQKRWLVSRFIELGERLIDGAGADLWVLGDSTESDLLASLAIRFPQRVHTMAGKASLRQTAALIKASKLFLGNDSGLFHIAGAVGTPTVSFFGPTSPHGKQPVWLPHKVLYTQEECSPCYKHGSAPPCPYDLKCMQHISTRAAFEAIQDLLNNHAPAI